MPRNVYLSDVFSQQLRGELLQAYHTTAGTNWAIAQTFVGTGSIVDALELPVVNIKIGDEVGILRGERPATFYERGNGESRKFVEFRMVKLLRKLCPQQFSDKAWEEFGNYLTPRLWPTWSFEVLRGSAIRTAYHESSYAYGSGTMSNSCMRYSSCKSFFQIYWKNPDVCRLLVSKNDDGLITGRALIWTTEDGTIVADRIYGNDKTISAIRKHISEQGWWNRGEYIGDDGWSWIKPDGTEEIRHMRVNVRNCRFQTYPYMDTFRCLDKGEGYLTTNPDDGEWSLSSTSGDAGYMGRREMCPECNSRFRASNGWRIPGEPMLCRPCGRRLTAQCSECSDWHRRDNMVQAGGGYWYCQRHAPRPCTVCQMGVSEGRAFQHPERGRVCGDCYDNLYNRESYVTVDGFRLTRREYESREECGVCHRYWSPYHSYPIPISFDRMGQIYECRDCRDARMTVERTQRRDQVAAELSAMERWRQRWGADHDVEPQMRVGCNCQECIEYRAAELEDSVSLLTAVIDINPDAPMPSLRETVERHIEERDRNRINDLIMRAAR